MKIVFECHRARISVRDVRPQNFVFNPKTNDWKLNNLSAATLIARERKEQLKHAQQIVCGALNYMDPVSRSLFVSQQTTGNIDLRAQDLYALGITFLRIHLGTEEVTESQRLAYVKNLSK